MDISKNDFVRLTTQGYPLNLEHPLDDFYTMFAEFVNQTKENNFFAEVESGVILHAGMRTEICKVVYENGRVIILSKITDKNNSSSTGEFNVEEELQILGHACLGVLYFCDLYSDATNQNTQSISTPKKSDVGDNTKYDIWPM